MNRSLGHLKFVDPSEVVASLPAPEWSEAGVCVCVALHFLKIKIECRALQEIDKVSGKLWRFEWGLRKN